MKIQGVSRVVAGISAPTGVVKISFIVYLEKITNRGQQSGIHSLGISHPGKIKTVIEKVGIGFTPAHNKTDGPTTKNQL